MTGMSGTGKSTALRELRRRGFEVVDTDEPGWTEWRDEDGGFVWREPRIAELLARDRTATLYVSGTVSNRRTVLSPLRRRRTPGCAGRGTAPPDREQDDERLRQDCKRSATSSSATLPKSNRCCVPPARMRSMRPSRSRRSSRDWWRSGQTPEARDGTLAWAGAGYEFGSTILATTQRCLPIFRSRTNPSCSYVDRAPLKRKPAGTEPASSG